MKYQYWNSQRKSPESLEASLPIEFSIIGTSFKYSSAHVEESWLTLDAVEYVKFDKLSCRGSDVNLSFDCSNSSVHWLALCKTKIREI